MNQEKPEAIQNLFTLLEVPLPNQVQQSGCGLSCAESWVRDIGLYGKPDGWVLLAGGNVGASPRIAQEILTELSDEEALAKVEEVVDFYQKNAKKGERMGKMIDRLGLDSLKKAVR